MPQELSCSTRVESVATDHGKGFLTKDWREGETECGGVSLEVQ